VAKKRIDSLLVERELVESRSKAQAMIMAGEVSAGGVTITKAGTMVTEEAVIAISEPPPFVSRGGLKLDYALDRFGLDVSSLAVVDVGASTGGFTDCLLKRGANRVYAIDVGYGQLDYRLRQDSRVVVMERVNARYAITLPEQIDLVTMDVSFISVTKVIPAVTQLMKENGSMLVLIKPQFEARKKEVGKGGVIKQPVIHARVLGRFVTWITENSFRLKGLIASPVLGTSGNREFFTLVKLT